MKTVSIRFSDMKDTIVYLGYVGENLHRRVLIDCKKEFEEMPGAVVSMVVTPPHGDKYPATVTVEGNTVMWDVTNSDLIYDGNGEIQLTLTKGNEVGKSARCRTKIEKSSDPTGTTPTPIENWINHANEVLEEVENAEIHQPIIGDDGYWYRWNQETGAYVKTDTKAQGEDGEPGQPGQPGRDGTDATPDLITKPYSQLTFPVTKGTQCYQNGKLYEANQDIPTSEQWTAAHWTETTVEEQLREQKSDLLPFPKTAAAGDVGKYLKLKTVENGKPKEYEYGTPSGGGDVTDVKVNNVSVLDGTVAKVPLASSSAPGVVKVNAGGLQMVDDTIKIAKAQDSVVKAGTVETAPIVPSNQHLAAFYGLAKAANDTSQASSANAVGSYTDDAKIKIQKMLGIYEAPWELIRTDTVTNATEEDVEITVDGNGESFDLTDVYLQVWTPQQETDASIGDYGQVRSYYDSSNYITSQMNTWSQAANATARYGQVLLENKNGAILNIVTQNATQYSAVGLIGRTNIPNNDALLKIGTFAFNKIVIKKVTGTVQYKLYGKRKWN